MRDTEPNTKKSPDEWVTLAESGAAIDDPLLRTMLADYRAAHDSKMIDDVGQHWNCFRPDFDRLIRTPGVWARFRRFAISYGFDDSLKYGEGRNSPELKPAFYSHRGPAVKAWRFDDTEMRKDIQTVIMRARATLTPDTIQALGEATIGDPATQEFADFPIPVDYHDLSTIHFASVLHRALEGRRRERILEIGGGYGALSAKLRRLDAGTRFVSIDLPETLAVQRWYLSRAMPGARLVGYGDYQRLGLETALRVADVLLLPPAAISELPADFFDVAINIRSLSEMTESYVARYVAEIQRTMRKDGTFYCVNNRRKSTSGDEFRIDKMPLDDYWRFESATPVPWQAHIVELMIRRSDATNPTWRETLAASL